MVLFDESPVSLIHATTSQFHIQPDKDSLSRIASSLSALSAARAARVDHHRTLLAQLARQLNRLQDQAHFDADAHDPGRHASELLRLDTEKFRVAKGVSEAEIEAERLEAELAALERQCGSLEKEGPQGPGGKAEGVEDEVVLKLHAYRSLGIQVAQDPTTGEFTRAIARNAARGDVNVVHVDGTMSRSFYADLLWESV